eukprot:CAMPEP_0116915538 /NCGR_PEP_ID=MMETSP0467-20121206/17986_1 /TAXON_ID=283647 /ORGANISM="Mesodinium pulex, Strain SPMC105" /LENGTH=81 /DNA_ID=CAMNT_0004592217 /DNA_START=695 /DNA_END=941 /DNA_ORIENTATION=+
MSGTADVFLFEHDGFDEAHLVLDAVFKGGVDVHDAVPEDVGFQELVLAQAGRVDVAQLLRELHTLPAALVVLGAHGVDNLV